MKLIKTALFLAAVCCLGFTSCDKDEKETPFTGNISFDNFTSTFTSAVYASIEAGGQSALMAYLSPTGTKNIPQDLENGSATVAIGNWAPNTVYDLTKFDEEAGVVVDFYTIQDGKEYEFSLSPDEDSSNKYYVLSRKIDGLTTVADDVFKVKTGTFKYTIKGSKLSFELNVTSEKDHSMTLSGSGTATKTAIPTSTDLVF